MTRDEPKVSSGAAILVLAATLLTLFLAAPVLRAPDERLFGNEIVGRHHDPYTLAVRFERPLEWHPYTQPATDFAGAALARLFGDGFVAYNLLVLLSFPLAALFTYLLARRLEASRAAAGLAALLYAFSPFHLAHAAYHPHVAQTQWLPLYLLALWLCLERATLARLCLLAFATGLTALSNYYAGLIAAVLTPFALAGFWWTHRASRGHGSRRSLAWTVLVLALLAVAGVVFASTAAPQVWSQPEAFAFDRAESARYGAWPSAYIVPPVEHPVAGGWSRQLWEQRRVGDALLEQQVTVGLGLLALAAAGLGGSLRDSSTRWAPALALIAVAAFLFSVRPTSEAGGLGALLPASHLREALPMFRAFARFGMAVTLALTLGAALGFDWLRRRRSALGRGAALGLAALVLLELAPWPPWRWRDVLPTTAHRWLERQPPPVRVLDCVPSASPGETGVPLIFPHEIGVRVEEDCRREEIGGWLAARGYTHLLIRSEARLVERWGATPAGLEALGSFEDAQLFEVTGPPAPLSVELVKGFHRAEVSNGRDYRWMGAEALLVLLSTLETPVDTALELDLHAFQGPRTALVRLDGRELGALVVDDRPQRYSLGPFVLTPGVHSVELKSLEATVVAGEVLGNGDPRELSFALWDWRLTTGSSEPGARSD